MRRPGFIELNRISENALKDLARKHNVESKAALAWNGMGAAAGGTVAIIANLNSIEDVKTACESAGWEILDWKREGDTRQLQDEREIDS